MSAQSIWQKIETAPKDGTRILIWSAEIDSILSVVWDAEFDYEWDDKKDKQRYLGAWTDHAVASFGYEEYKSYQPTHWMSLPEPPQ